LFAASVACIPSQLTYLYGSSHAVAVTLFPSISFVFPQYTFGSKLYSPPPYPQHAFVPYSRPVSNYQKTCFFYDVLNNMLSNNVLKTGQNGPSRELASSPVGLIPIIV
jgi:hypothetical protein